MRMFLNVTQTERSHWPKMEPYMVDKCIVYALQLLTWYGIIQVELRLWCLRQIYLKVWYHCVLGPTVVSEDISEAQQGLITFPFQLKSHGCSTVSCFSQRCHLVVEKKKEIVAKRSQRSERSPLVHHSMGSRGPLKGPWWGSRRWSLPKLMDFSLLKPIWRALLALIFWPFVTLCL